MEKQQRPELIPAQVIKEYDFFLANQVESDIPIPSWLKGETPLLSGDDTLLPLGVSKPSTE